MHLPYDVLLFDLDGTLTNSEPGIVKSVQYALTKMGRPDLTEISLRHFVGPPLLDSFMDLGFSEPESMRAIELFRERYQALGIHENSVYAGIPAILRTLKAHGAYTAVVTSKPDVLVGRVLEQFGLARYFDRIVTRTFADHRADKADMIRRALPDKYRRACMVGDRCFDIDAAHATGIDGIGALYGCGTLQELTQAGATAIAEDTLALSRILLGDTPIVRGAFITLEGSDGCGKSTQARAMRQWLEMCGWRVVATREPGGCPIAERVRAIVLDAKESGMTDVCEALLFAAARAQHVHDVIEPALQRGEIVLCDRFVDSSVVYQGVGRGLGADWVRQVNDRAVNGCMPDRTIVFDIDPTVALGRRVCENAPDRIESTKDTGFVTRVFDAYKALAHAEPERVQLVDATGAPDEVARKIRELIAELL